MSGQPRLFLVRHGETEWSAGGRHTGWTDVPLDDRGRRQALLLAARLADETFGAVISSPLSRALETCRLVGLGDRASIDPDGLSRTLYGPAFEIATGVPHAAGFGLWLALHDPAYCHISDDRPAPTLAESARFLLMDAGYRLTMGLLEGDSLCLLLRSEADTDDQGIRIRCYGPDTDAARSLGERLLGHLGAWHAAGQPTFKTLHLRVYPIGAMPDPPAATLIAKRWHTLAIDWDHG